VVGFFLIMDIIEKNSINYIYCNISNEVENSYYTMSIETAEYSVDVTLAAPLSVNGRYVSFILTDGTQDLPNAVIDLPNKGDYPYKITNATTLSGTVGIVIQRGILRLKQSQEVVYSYTSEQTTIIYE
jgi:hypothetical protein